MIENDDLISEDLYISIFDTYSNVLITNQAYLFMLKTQLFTFKNQ